MTAQPSTSPAGPADAQPAGLKTRQEDQDRTLRALHRLERNMSAAAAGRAKPWHEHALAALAAFDEATADEQRNANQPDSLLSDIARMHSRLRPRVNGIRAQYVQIRETLSTLRLELTQADPDELDVTDLRRRADRLASALRYQRARESDLIYEAYYDTYDTDIEADIAGTT